MRWKPIYDEIVLLTLQKVPVPEISKKVGLGKAQIFNVRKTDIFKARTDEYQLKQKELLRDEVQKKVEAKLAENQTLDEAIDSLINDVPHAVLTLKELARTGAKNDNVRLSACKEILDRSGLKPPEVIETRSRDYSPAEIQQASKTLNEIVSITERLTKQTESRFVLNPNTTIVALRS